jgi:hypothetical protein
MARSDTAQLSADLLEGVQAIAKFTGLKPRRIFYLAEHAKLPLFKIGSRWCARRSTLVAYIARLESGEAAERASPNQSAA